MLMCVFPLQMMVNVINCSLFTKDLALAIVFPAMCTSREDYDLNPDVRTN